MNNVFAGNVVFVGNQTISGKENIEGLDFDYIESLSKDGNKVLYVSGETTYKKSDDIVKILKEQLGELKNYDISIFGEDKIELFDADYEEGFYELASFEGEMVDYNEICERFKDIENVASVREAEISERFGNRVVRVDFIY